MLKTKYGGAGNIDDTAPSVATTYSGTKTQDLHNTQAVQISSLETEVLIDAVNETVYIPEDNDTGASLTRSVIIDATGVSGGTPLASNTVIIGANDGVATSAFGSVLIGEDTTALAGGNKTGAVVVGQRASANSNNINGSVVLGFEALSTAADATNSVVIGQNASLTSGTQTDLVAIGTEAGPIGAGDYDKQVYIGPNMNTTLRNFDISGAITVADRDIIIGAGTDTPGDDNRPLIHASNSDLAPHWSTGHEDATLGTSSRPWNALYVTNIVSNSFEHLVGQSVTAQLALADQTSHLAIFDGIPNGVTALGNIDVLTSGGHTSFRNVSGVTRRWHIQASIRFQDLAGVLTQCQMWVNPAPNHADVPAFGGVFLAHSHLEFTPGGVGTTIRLQTSIIYEVPANEYIRIGFYADTDDGSLWDVAINPPTAFDANQIRITELPQ